jgi:hypothetical protein
MRRGFDRVDGMDKKQSVYIESTVPSYGSARDSFNVLNVVRKKQTLEFWSIRHLFKLWISDAVLAEIGKGDEEAAARRLEFVKDIDVLPDPEGLDELAIEYLRLTGIPDRASADCVHLAHCVLGKIDYLVSWNMGHLGVESQKKIQEYNGKHGLWTPLLVTPDILYTKYQEETL